MNTITAELPVTPRPLSAARRRCMLGVIAAFEIRYHLRRPSTYFFFAVLFAVALIFLGSNAVGALTTSKLVSRNSPYALARLMAVVAAIGQVITGGLVGMAAIRDYRYLTHELLFTTPLRKLDFLAGRFVGVFAVMLLVYTAIPLGAAAATLMPWVDASALLPFSASSYLHSFILVVVPSLFVVTALFFAVGALTRNELAVYVQGIVLLTAWGIAGSLLASLDQRRLAALMDVFGIDTISYATRYWSVAEKNARILAPSGAVLENKLIWIGIALGALTFAYLRFSARIRAPRNLRRARANTRSVNSAAVRTGEGARAASAQSASDISTAVHATRPHFDGHTGARQLASLTRLSFLRIVKDKPFLAVAVAGLLNAASNAWNSGQWFGTAVYPVTSRVAEGILTGTQFYFVIIAAIYAGELAWRERQMRASQIVDALPVPTAAMMTGKLFGLILAEAALFIVLMVAGIAVQAAKGYYHFEIGLYFRYLFGVQFPSVVAVTLLAFCIHSVLNNKYVGHLLIIVWYIGTESLTALGFEHQLWHFGQWPDFTYSEMNGFGHFVPDLFWLLVTWLFVGLTLGVVAHLFWVRGTDTRLRVRLREARARLGARTGTTGGLGICGALLAGGIVFFNTNILNSYRTSGQEKSRAARYETTYRRYAALPQPWLVDVHVRADLVPEHRALTVSGVQTYVNREARPLDTLFVQIDPTVGIDSLAWSLPVERFSADSVQGVYLYRLRVPLAPGDTLRLSYGVRYQARGFPNSEPNNSIVANGTAINPDEEPYVPALGYQPRYELHDASDRAKHRLPARARSASVTDQAAAGFSNAGSATGWVAFDAVVSTAPDQIALAPGELVGQWMENGRRVFHYHAYAPMLPAALFLSARYTVRRDHWRSPSGQDIPIAIFYHPSHSYNLDRLVRATQRSLVYYTANFGPYQFRQFRMAEVPEYRPYAAAAGPNTILFTERAGFLMRVRDADVDLDMPFFVTAHELSHQWWAHQVIGADVQGRAMLSESLAQYSAMMVMEHEYGSNVVHKFLRYELDRYLAGRSTEQQRELPLMLVEDGQSYIHYFKGALAFYALRDYLGEDRVNAVLRAFLARHRFQGPPFPTSQELVADLRAATPDSLQHVITDLFETITLWDLRADTAVASLRPDGRYDVRLVVDARKFRADSLGSETAIPVDDYVDIGVFGGAEKGNPLGRPLFVQKYHVTRERTVVNVTVSARPERAGIDPYNILIDREPSDNVRPVEWRSVTPR